MRKSTPTPSPRRRGHAVVEVALMAPWIFLLFIAVFNFGFYAYTLISVENAARVAAVYTSSVASSSADAAGACYHAGQELAMMPNLVNVTGSSLCTCSGATCTLGPGSPPPLSVTVQSFPGGSCPDAGYVVGNSLCSQVTVTYRGIQLFPLPWLMGRLSVSRTAIAKVRTD